MTDVLPIDEVARIKRLGAPSGLCDSHEALRSQLAVAYDIIRRLRDGWEPDIPCIGPEVWCWFRGDEDPEPVTEAERTVLGLTAACGRSVGAFWCVRPAGHDGECNRAYRSGRPTTGAVAGPNDPSTDDEPMLNVLCECGHRAGKHGHSSHGIPNSQCYERVDVEQWCECRRFVSTGVLAGPNDTEENGDGD